MRLRCIQVYQENRTRYFRGDAYVRCYDCTMSLQRITQDEKSVAFGGSGHSPTNLAFWKPRKHSRFNRLIIYPKDIQCITGKSERYGRMMLQKIREHLKKEEHQLITVDEFCAYAGLNVEAVTSFLA